MPECSQCPGKATCHVYGVDTQRGRDAWVKFAIDTVTNGGLDGVFIDGKERPPFHDGLRACEREREGEGGRGGGKRERERARESERASERVRA